MNLRGTLLLACMAIWAGSVFLMKWCPSRDNGDPLIEDVFIWSGYIISQDRVDSLYALGKKPEPNIITYRHTKDTWHGIVRQVNDTIERDKVRSFTITPDSWKLKTNPYETN